MSPVSVLRATLPLNLSENHILPSGPAMMSAAAGSRSKIWYSVICAPLGAANHIAATPTAANADSARAARVPLDPTTFTPD